MQTIEIRRHCFTKKGETRGKGSHLSAEGVIQARRIGEQLGPFDLVLTSHVPRTLETALAMGFAVVYHESKRWHFFYGKVGSPHNLNRLLVPDAAQWQAQAPDWLHGKREVVLERIGRDAKWVQIVTEPEQA